MRYVAERRARPAARTLLQGLSEVPRIVGRHPPQKVNILFRVELGHFLRCREVWALRRAAVRKFKATAELDEAQQIGRTYVDRKVLVQVEGEQEVVCQLQAVGLHGVAWAVVVVPHVALVKVRHTALPWASQRSLATSAQDLMPRRQLLHSSLSVGFPRGSFVGTSRHAPAASAHLGVEGMLENQVCG